MNLSEWLVLYDRDQRQEIIYPDMVREARQHVVRHTRPAPGSDFIIYSDLAGADVEAVIQDEKAYFSNLNQPYEWKVYSHDQPADLKDRLAVHGFTIDEPEAIMALDLQQAPTELLEPATADIRPIRCRQELGDVIQVLEEVWERKFDWVWDRLGAHLEIRGYLNVYVAYVENAPACAAWVYFNPGSMFGSLWGGSTRSAYRQRGLYSALLAVRAQEAARRGVRFLTVDASPMSAPILLRHGFVQIATAWACEVNL